MREKWIDRAKGIAMLLVIIGHTYSGLTGIWNFSWVYGVHLVMFFLLSGYTLKKQKPDADYLNKKYSRLMVPYFYTCFAVLIADIWNSFFLKHDASVQTITGIIGRDLLRSFFASGGITTFGELNLGTRIGAIWFLPALFFALVIVQFVLNQISDDKIAGICCALIALGGVISARFIWLPFSIQSGMLASFFVWIGYMLKKNSALNRLKWYHYVAAQIILLFGIHFNFCGIGFVSASVNDLILSIPVGIAGCLLIYLLSKINIGIGFFEFIGNNSLFVLCTHLFALETLNEYFRKILDELGTEGNIRIGLFILLEFLFAVGSAAFIQIIKKYAIISSKKAGSADLPLEHSDRDRSVDIVKGILILSMLLGHFSIDSCLRSVIYSCHMAAFVILSGYFYRSSRSISKTIRKMLRSFLLPYFLFIIGYVILNRGMWNESFFRETAKTYLCGISFTKKLFTSVPSVGPVYFVLMLFLVRLLYMVLDRIIINKTGKTIAVICISVFGYVLGNNGWWLPWSLDISCYALAFYRIGIWFREYDVLKKVSGLRFTYFVLAPVWVYMIYSGSMEIAVRNYGQYGLVILGSCAGTLLIYKLAVFINGHFPVCGKALQLLGRHSIVLIIVHTLLGNEINRILSLRFDSQYFPFLVCSMAAQVFISLAMVFIINAGKSFRKNFEKR